MKPHRFFAPFFLVTFLLLLVSCDPPQLQVEKKVESTDTPDPGVESSPAPPASAGSGHTASAAEEPPDRAPEEPELHVAKEGNRIVISGALRSEIQQKRIMETLAMEFPDIKIEGGLTVEFHRNPAGWGNRIADTLLVPYLREVKDPRIQYKDSIVMLGGTVANNADLKRLTEMAIETFTGGNATDIDNQLKVEQIAR